MTSSRLMGSPEVLFYSSVEIKCKSKKVSYDNIESPIRLMNNGNSPQTSSLFILSKDLKLKVP